MSILVSVIIPCASYHLDLLPRAIASAEAQTIPCEIIPILDNDRRGPGYCRNQGLAQANGLFCLWLDSDDWLLPHCVAEMVSAYQEGTYVYSDHIYEQGEYHATPDDCPYHYGTWHGVTALTPTSAARAIGGFNEQMVGQEDAEFFLRLMEAGICGIRVSQSLWIYGQAGQRSIQSKQHPEFQVIRKYLAELAGRSSMSCCGEGQLAPQVPSEGEKQAGDVLVTALYEPQVKFGPVTGRSYPRPKGPYGYRIWVSPLDYEHPRAAGWWRLAEQPRVQTPNLDEVIRLAGDAYKLR